jgi:hypothetical protein
MISLLINDLAESKDLDRGAMLTVRGGGNPTLNSFNAQALAAEARGGIAAITAATQTLVGVNNVLDLNLDVSPVTSVVVGGTA